jgi:hypothetical protein
MGNMGKIPNYEINTGHSVIYAIGVPKKVACGEIA